tara:strand:+ start:70021 stop:70239 length:219 start_codon:yes stop_codon:yes gene_type:complete
MQKYTLDDYYEKKEREEKTVSTEPVFMVPGMNPRRMTETKVGKKYRDTSPKKDRGKRKARRKRARKARKKNR